MKLQLTSESLRLRISESELAQLLDGGRLTLQVGVADHLLLQLETVLTPSVSFATSPHWVLSLPELAVREYARSLPRRDALVILIPAMEPLAILFEVDVRDSVRVRAKPGRA